VNLVLLTTGLGGALSVQYVQHRLASDRSAPVATINLLILDVRKMSQRVFTEACVEVEKIRAQQGVKLGVILCQQPTIPITVAAIRCGLRDMINQYATARHLHQLLRLACPGIRVREYDALVAFIRTFTGISKAEKSSADLARREQDLARRLEEATALEKKHSLDRDTLARREAELKERTRRFDRQLARMQNDADLVGGDTPEEATTATASRAPFVELDAMSKRLDQRAIELDAKEKLLNEMQNLLLTTPVGAVLKQHL
jgi:hypothetical protein